MDKFICFPQFKKINSGIFVFKGAGPETPTVGAEKKDSEKCLKELKENVNVLAYQPYELSKHDSSTKAPDGTVLIEGSVDATKFRKRLRPLGWYQKMSSDAKALLNIFEKDSRALTAPTYALLKSKETLLKELANVSFSTSKEFQDNFEKKHSDGEILGGTGIYNTILAFQRVLDMAKKDGDKFAQEHTFIAISIGSNIKDDKERFSKAYSENQIGKCDLRKTLGGEAEAAPKEKEKKTVSPETPPSPNKEPEPVPQPVPLPPRPPEGGEPGKVVVPPEEPEPVPQPVPLPPRPPEGGEPSKIVAPPEEPALGLTTDKPTPVEAPPAVPLPPPPQPKQVQSDVPSAPPEKSPEKSPEQRVKEALNSFYDKYGVKVSWWKEVKYDWPEVEKCLPNIEKALRSIDRRDLRMAGSIILGEHGNFDDNEGIAEVEGGFKNIQIDYDENVDDIKEQILKYLKELGVQTVTDAKPAEARPEQVKPQPPPVPEHEKESFSNPEFLKPISGGEFTAEERAQRISTVTTSKGLKITLFDDIGLTFYQVKSGDTIKSIRQKLAQLPRYKYLLDESQAVKIKSFNIPDDELKVGMWIPIPLENKDRELSDRQFFNCASKAIDQMVQDPNYGKDIRTMISKAGDKSKLIAAMIAVAKQESGRALGKFELHRWEPHYKAFSFSLFHVLMEKDGPGITARRSLNLTEGQLYHPQNAAKLFLAFVIEKSKQMGKDPARFFPLNQHFEEFADFYNGTGWRKINPEYVDNLRKYY